MNTGRYPDVTRANIDHWKREAKRRTRAEDNTKSHEAHLEDIAREHGWSNYRSARLIALGEVP